MTITSGSDNDIIVSAHDNIIGYARKTEQIFIAQCMWWLASVIRLETEFVSHINKLRGRTIVEEPKLSEEACNIRHQNKPATSSDENEKIPQDKVLKDCKEFLRDSRRLRQLDALKAKVRTQFGRIKPTPISKKKLRAAAR
jgi:hypothetical protein